MCTARGLDLKDMNIKIKTVNIEQVETFQYFEVLAEEE